MNYEQGLHIFKQLAQDTPWHEEFLLYETALRANLRAERLYGPSPQTHHDIMRLVDHLNHTALQHLGASFTDFCLESTAHLSSRSGTVDVGIIFALKEEFLELFRELRSYEILNNPSHKHYYYKFDYTSNASNHRYHCVTTFIGEMGPIKASLATKQFLHDVRPRTLLLLGISGALSNELRIGDIVIASQVDAYLENSKAVDGPLPNTYSLLHNQGDIDPEKSMALENISPSTYSFLLSGEMHRGSADLLRFTRHFSITHQNMYQHWQEERVNELKALFPDEQLTTLMRSDLIRDSLHILEGHLASGSTVVTSSVFAEWLKRQNRRYLALDMESAGSLAAVHEQTSPIRTLIIRAISDYADARKTMLDHTGEGAFRRYAIRNAIHLLWKFLDAGLPPAAEFR